MRHLVSAATGLLLLLPTTPTLAVDGPDIDEVAAAWVYPEATDVLSAGKPSFYNTMFKTPDDVHTVLKHYAKKLGVDPGNMADPDGAIGVLSGSVESGESFSIVKSTSAAMDGVEEVAFTHKSTSALTTLVIHRVRDGDLTRVTVFRAELVGG
ncbi:hypothetical protein [Tautonia plasticadhaerens]|uniref:DUF4440 domain-containing protein n=1 Tax=Tautonia plasticadhaerens TaxID=2527974 RepID=A0A518H0D4_9BACT|nr:hypothetical protein [Tautonia plasticadhaerens]QDV34271.1 hypothetical protein ElP_21560 [Tautonia plasticadhaerens]